MTYIPYVGTKGIFTFLSPVDKIIPEVELTVQGIRSIENLSVSGVNVYEYIYKPLNISENDYKNDMINNVPIVEFNDPEGKYYAVPASYILSVPDISGVNYKKKIIAIDIDLIKDNEDITYFLKELKDLTLQELGIEPSVKLIDASPVIKVSKEDDALITKKRKANLAGKKSVFVKLKECENLTKLLSKQVNILSKLVKGWLPLN